MIENDINNLVNIIIIDHINGKLGKTNIKNYILTKYPNLNDIELINVIYHLGNKLSNKGFEIKFNIDKFDIVNFNSKEYKDYVNELKKLEINNKFELENKAKILTNEFLKMYDKDNSLKYILKSLFKDKHFTQKEEAFVRINIINNLTNMGYIIQNVDPLILKKI